jgi:hypothetical protein
LSSSPVILLASRGTLGVELKRVPLPRAALRAVVEHWAEAPALLRDDLLLQYAWSAVDAALRREC